MPRLSRLGQLRLFLRRNWLLHRRDPKGTLLSLALPLVVFLFLASLKSSTSGAGGAGSPSAKTTVPEVRNQQPLSLDSFEIVARSPQHRESVLLYAPRSFNASAASASYVERIMDRLRATLKDPALIVGVESAQAVQEHWDRSNAAQASKQPSTAGAAPIKQAWAAIVFGSEASPPSEFLSPTLPCDVIYNLRLNGSVLPSSSRSAEFVVPRSAGAGGSQQVDDGSASAAAGATAGRTSVATAQYLSSGFLTLQRAVNQAILDVRLAETMSAAAAPSPPVPMPATDLHSLFSSYLLQFQSFPSAAQTLDPYHAVMVSIGPLYMILAYLPLLQKLVVALVQEKEKRTKESMKIAGLVEEVFVAGWYVTYLLMSGVPILITAALASAYGFYETTSASVLFALLFLYMQCLLLFAFALSTLFSKSKLAGQVSSAGIFLIFLPQYIWPLQGEGSAADWIAMLSPPIVFAKGFVAIADAESAGIELSFPSHLSGAPVSAPFSLGFCLLFLVIDMILLAALAWYLEQVVPGEYGLSKPWFFPCAACCSRRGGRGGEEEEEEEMEEEQAEHGAAAGSALDDGPERPGRQSRRYLPVPSLSLLGPTNSQPSTPIEPIAPPVSVSAVDGVRRPDPRAPAIEEPIHYTPAMVGRGGDEQGLAVAEAHAIRPGIRMINVRKTFDARGGGFWSGMWKQIQSGFGLCCAGSRRVRDGSSAPEKGTIQALRGLSLRIARGEILALLGPNASGKTTTVSLLSGLLAPDRSNRGGSSGRIIFEGMGSRRLDDGGRDPLVLSSHSLEAVREHLFLCPQSDVFFDTLTVQEHLHFYAELRGIPAHGVAEHAMQKLQQLGLGEKARERVKDLSGGQKRKLCVALALMGLENQPPAFPGGPSLPPPDCRDILVLDEPSSGVDLQSRKAIWEVVQHYRAGRVTLLTTHSMAEAEQLADRIAILHRGVLKCAGSAMFLKRHYGQGYKLLIEVDKQITNKQIREITELIQSYCSGAQRVQRTVGPNQPQQQQQDAEHDDDEEEEKQSAASFDPSASPSDDTIELTFLLPLSSLDSFPALFHALESPATLARFHILPTQGLNVSLNSMEEIFFRVVEDEDEEDEAEAAAEAGARAREVGGVAAHEEEEIELEELAHASDAHNDRHPLRGGRAARHSDADMLPPSSDDHDQVSMDLGLDSLSAAAVDVDRGSSPGISLHGSPPAVHPHPPFLRVFRGLVAKRWQLAGRDKRSLFFLLLFPVLYVSFGLSVNLKGVDTAILHSGGSVNFAPSKAGEPESAYDRLFSGAHARLPLAVHTPRAHPEHSWIDALFATTTSAAARTIPEPQLITPAAGSPRPADPSVSFELDALDGFLLSTEGKDDDHAFAYAALYVDEAASAVAPSAGQPLAPRSTFRVLTNNSATHAAPVLTNAIYSSLLRHMSLGEEAWSLDASDNAVHTAAAGTVSDPCPSRSIIASSTPFAYASSPLLQLANFLLGILIVVSLGYVPIYAAVQILKNEKLAAIAGSVGGGGEGASSNAGNNSLAGSTNLSLQKLHGGSKFAARFWLCNGLVDTVLTLQPVFAILLLFAAVGNTLMLGPNFPAALCMFAMWAAGMVGYSYLWTFRFGKLESLQLVLGLLYSTVNLVLFLVLASYKLVSGLIDVVQDASDHASETHGQSNPFTNMDFDFEIVRGILSTTGGIVALIAVYPCFALPWGTLQLAMQNYLNLKREASCALDSQSGAVGSGSSEDDGIAAPVIPCESSSAWELFVFARMGGVLFGLALSLALSSLFLLWKERYLARWWKEYVSKTEQTQQARFRVPPPPNVPAGGWALPQHQQQHPQQSQGLLMALPQSSPPAPVPASLAPARAGPNGGDLELGRLVAAQAAAPLPSFVAGGLGMAAGIGPGAPLEPADVAEERARVRAQFDAQGNPLPAEQMDPITMLELRKTFKLTEPIVLPPAELSPAQLAQLRAAGIDPAFAPNAGPPIILREKQAIANVSLGVSRGTTFGLLGPNGAGKSSMMSVLCGTLVPDSGRAFFHGVSCVDSAASPAFGLAASNSLGFVPQSLGLFEALTAGEHMQLYGRIRGLDEGLIRARTRRFFRALKLTAHADTLAEHLSGGSKRKLLLSLALIGDPSILLLDEVSTGVDVSSRKAMWTLLQSASGSSRSTILTTHSMEEAEALSTRLGIVVNGTMRCIGRARTLKRNHGGGLELQVKLRALVHTGHIVAPLEAPHAQVPVLSPEQQRDQFIPLFTKFVYALVDASRVVPGSSASSPRLPGHSLEAGADEEKDGAVDDSEAHITHDGTFNPAALPPLPGFPFAAPPSADSLAAASSPASAGARAIQGLPSQSARLVSHYNGLLTFALPSTDAAGQPSSAASSAASSAEPASAAPAASFSLSRFFAYMQLYREGYGIDDFALNQSTLDAVFLKFAREQIDPES